MAGSIEGPYRAVATALAIVALAACGGGTQTASPSTGGKLTPVAGGTVTLRQNGDFASFDPQVNTGPGSNMALQNYATLLTSDAHGKLVGYLANSFSVSGSSITFTLKKGPTCADGTPVTPTVVKSSFQRMLDIKAAYMSALFGGPFTMQADDAAGTFTLTTSAPYSDLPYSFADSYGGSPAATGIICPAGLKDPSQLVTKMFGAGPYQLVEAIHGDHVTMKLRSDFTWGPLGITAKTVGIPDTIVFKVVSNDTTAANLLVTGGLDTAAIGGPDINRLVLEKSLVHFEQKQFTLNILYMNALAGHPTADVKVRQAIATAIDPKAWVNSADGGFGRASTSYVTPDAPCYDATTEKLAPKTNVAAARKVLTDAGWTYSGGKLANGGQPLTLKMIMNNQFLAGPEYVQKQLTDMGATVDLQNLSITDYVSQAIFGGNFDVTTGTVAGQFVPLLSYAPARFTGPIYPKGTNFGRTQDSALDQAFATAKATVGPDQCKAYSAVQQQMWKNYDVLPLSAPTVQYFSRGVDVSVGPLNMYKYKRVKQS